MCPCLNTWSKFSDLLWSPHRSADCQPSGARHISPYWTFPRQASPARVSSPAGPGATIPCRKFTTLFATLLLYVFIIRRERQKSHLCPDHKQRQRLGAVPKQRSRANTTHPSLALRPRGSNNNSAALRLGTHPANKTFYPEQSSRPEIRSVINKKAS